MIDVVLRNDPVTVRRASGSSRFSPCIYGTVVPLRVSGNAIDLFQVTAPPTFCPFGKLSSPLTPVFYSRGLLQFEGERSP